MRVYTKTFQQNWAQNSLVQRFIDCCVFGFWRRLRWLKALEDCTNVEAGETPNKRSTRTFQGN